MITKDSMFKSRAIYRVLQDELSKGIFVDKLLYAYTGNIEYVYKLVRNSIKGFGENLIHLSKKEIIVYGAGINCHTILMVCKEMNIKVLYICDINEKKQGAEVDGVKVISPKELIDKHQDAIVVISTTTYLDEVNKFLKPYFPEERRIPFATKQQIRHIKNQYFDEAMLLEEDGIFIDGGCFDFETSDILLQKYNPKKIYAFEPDKYSFDRIRKKIEKYEYKEIELINCGLWSRTDKLYFSAQGNTMSKIDDKGAEKIDVVALDDIICEKVTFIKMDIEGSELEALKGAEKIIKKYKPKLAICIYHKLEDVIDIPYFLLSIVPEYKFYIRHYSFNSSETVLYAV